MFFSKVLADRRGLQQDTAELVKTSLLFQASNNPALGLLMADERLTDKAALAKKAEAPPPLPLTNPEKERLELLEACIQDLTKLYRAKCLNEQEAYPILKKCTSRLARPATKKDTSLET